MISLIHPSRGRPGKSFLNSTEWIKQAGTDVELIVSVDKSDPFAGDYVKYYHAQCIVNDNSNVVQATNIAARRSKGDILLYLSDDFKCFPGWGQAIEKEFHKRLTFVPEPIVLKVDDCLQKFEVPVLTIPIMNREAYQRLGYFFHPQYRSMFCDTHLYERAKKLGFLRFAEHIKFEHCHVSVGKAANDETYQRSAANWNQGLALFKKHKAAGFVE